ncbi:MAG: hypothetical protein Q4G33_13010 [bacterium]|nr:hypothetical protein [bacterium]
MKSNGNSLLDDLCCTNEKDVDIVEQNFKYNLNVAEKLKKTQCFIKRRQRNEKKSRYCEIKDNIPPEDLLVVQEECRKIRSEGISQTVQTLQRTYGSKYDYDIFREAEKDVSKELDKKTQSLSDKIKHLQHELQKTQNSRKCNIYEQER